MKSINMDTKQLRYFISIAELGSIAAAARQMHIAQPALTRQVQSLEAKLNVSLFNRHPQGVQLTPAGEQFYEDALSILQTMERAKSHAVKANRGEMGSLKVGISPQHLWLTEVQQHLSAFRTHNPNIALNICTMQSRKQLIALRRGELDAGILFMRPLQDRDFEGQFLYRESMLLAVNKDSPFATHPPEKLDQLLDEPFIWTPRTNSFDFYKMVMNELLRSQFNPVIDHEGCDYNSMLSLVSAGRGYTFVPAVAKYMNVYNVVMHKMPQLNMTLDLELVWKRDNVNPCLPHMIKNYHHQIKRLT